MNGRNRANLLLLVLALVLGAVVLLVPEPRPERPPRAVAFDPAGVDRLELDLLDEDRPRRLRRRDGAWIVTAPTERPADSGRIARALAALGVRTESCYPAAEQEPREFGLEPPQAVLRLGRVRVAFGYRAPDGRRYIRAQERLCLVDDVTLPILMRETAAPVSG